MFDLTLLFAAGFLGGIMNSIAGGGTFITFPALLFVGVPPIAANATNTFAACSGYISGAYAFRHDMAVHKHELSKFIVIGILGGCGGAWLLLHTPEAVFTNIIPWLLLFATALFVFGSKLNTQFQKLGARHRHAGTAGAILLPLMLLAVCTYGGFFNAGLGIVSLSYLALAGYTNIYAMNGLKLLVSSCVSLVAIALFIWGGQIVWFEGTAMLVGNFTGGYIAARVLRLVSERAVRRFVIVASTLITAYFFYDVYGG